MGFEKTALIRDLMPWFGFPETDSEIQAQVVYSNGEISINWRIGKWFREEGNP